jgi:drug/metabolite transporter (DMT)-like permease
LTPLPRTVPRSLVHAALVVQTLVSAGTYLAVKQALVSLHWTNVVMLRNGAAALVYLSLLALTPGPVLPPRTAWKRVLFVAMVLVPLNQSLFIGGLSVTTPAHGALIFALTPLAVLAVSVLAGEERLTRAKALGTGLALAGCALVVLDRNAPAAAEGSWVGDLIVVGAMLSWVAYTVAGRPLVQRYGPIRATGWAFAAGALLIAPYGGPRLAEAPLSSLPSAAWTAVLFLVVMSSFVASLCWSFGLAHLEPSRVAVYSNLQPITTALLSWMVTGEPMTATLVAGGLLVIGGVVVATRIGSGRVTVPAAGPALE